jgi:hypothetical protein
MDARLFDVMVCPVCKGPLQHDRKAQELVCNADKLAFPIRDGFASSPRITTTSSTLAARTASTPK